MKKFKIALIIASLLPIQAYSLDVTGEWQGKNKDGVTNRLVITPSNNGYHADLFTATKNASCTGEAEGEAVLTGSTLKITEMKDDSSVGCTVNVSFSGKKANIESSENCSENLGAGCYFSGKLSKKK